jgi:DNA-binding response OmpR family regulator
VATGTCDMPDKHDKSKDSLPDVPHPVVHSVDDETVGTESTPFDPAAYTGLSLHILVIDDEENICRILSEILTATGHTVTTLTSAEEALELLSSASFDLIITDLVLTGMSGWDMSKIIRDTYLDQEIIIMTGGDLNIKEMNQQEHVVRMVLYKPIDFTLLMNSITRIFTDHPTQNNRGE